MCVHGAVLLVHRNKVLEPDFLVLRYGEGNSEIYLVSPIWSRLLDRFVNDIGVWQRETSIEMSVSSRQRGLSYVVHPPRPAAQHRAPSQA
jgi:hypothetical protein